MIKAGLAGAYDPVALPKTHSLTGSLLSKVRAFQFVYRMFCSSSLWTLKHLTNILFSADITNLLHVCALGCHALTTAISEPITIKSSNDGLAEGYSIATDQIPGDHAVSASRQDLAERLVTQRTSTPCLNPDL